MSKQVTNGYRTIVEQIDDQEVHDMIVIGSFGKITEDGGVPAVHSFMGNPDNLAHHVAELMLKNDDFKDIMTQAVAIYMHKSLQRCFNGGCN